MNNLFFSTNIYSFDGRWDKQRVELQPEGNEGAALAVNLVEKVVVVLLMMIKVSVMVVAEVVVVVVEEEFKKLW